MKFNIIPFVNSSHHLNAFSAYIIYEYFVINLPHNHAPTIYKMVVVTIKFCEHALLFFVFMCPALCSFSARRWSTPLIYFFYYYSHDSNHLVLVQFRLSLPVKSFMLLLRYCAFWEFSINL